MTNDATITTNRPRLSFAARAIALIMTGAFALSTGTTHARDASSTSQAGGHAIRSSYAACLTEAAGVTPAMKQCMGAEYDYQDKRLNKVYKALMAKLDKHQRAGLRSSERAWIAYRKSRCVLDPNGGQAAELDAYDCSVEATARQAATLEHRLHQAH